MLTLASSTTDRKIKPPKSRLLRVSCSTKANCLGLVIRESIPLKILHISESDLGGGAALAAFRQHQALRESGLDSTMVVDRKRSNDPTVRSLSPIMNLPTRVANKFRSWQMSSELAAYKPTASPRLELFSDDRVAKSFNWTEIIEAADVVNLHWIAGMLDYQRFFKIVPRSKAIVWTLHDMHAFTGGCHYSYECQAFTNQCGYCPQLGLIHKNDFSYRVLGRKLSALAGRDPNNTLIVADSHWLAEQARISALFKDFTVKVIHYGVDARIFNPSRRGVAKAALGIPEETQVVLFVADNVTNYRKGFDLLCEALSYVALEQPPLLLSVGSSGDLPTFQQEHRALGSITSEFFLSLVYSASDVFVAPSRAEAFGQVALEASACGTPVVAFDTGGLPDIVEDSRSGLLVRAGETKSMAQAIMQILSDTRLKDRMGQRGATIAIEKFSRHQNAEAYAASYRGLCES